MDIKIKPFFCRMGSKRTLRTVVPRYFPSDYSTYVEPFVGGGAIFFYNDFSGKKVVLNDLDKELMQNYKRLGRVSGDIYKYDIRGASHEKGTPARGGGLEKIRAIAEGSGGDEMEKLVRFLYKSCNTFGSKGMGKIYQPNNALPKLKNLDKYQAKLRPTTLTSSDYKAVIRRYDSPSTLFYLDPPYEGSDTGGIYKKGIDKVDLQEMANLLKTIKGKFILSINKSANVSNIFKDFKKRVLQVDTSAKQGFSASRGYGGEGTQKFIAREPRDEYLITNY